MTVGVGVGVGVDSTRTTSLIHDRFMAVFESSIVVYSFAPLNVASSCWIISLKVIIHICTKMLVAFVFNLYKAVTIAL